MATSKLTPTQRKIESAFDRAYLELQRAHLARDGSRIERAHASYWSTKEAYESTFGYAATERRMRALSKQLDREQAKRKQAKRKQAKRKPTTRNTVTAASIRRGAGSWSAEVQYWAGQLKDALARGDSQAARYANAQIEAARQLGESEGELT